jgi:hypothetical protein
LVDPVEDPIILPTAGSCHTMPKSEFDQPEGALDYSTPAWEGDDLS